MKKAYTTILFFLAYIFSYFVSFSDAENGGGAGAGDNDNNGGGANTETTFDPSKVDKTYKINNEEHKFSDILTKAAEKYGIDPKLLTEEKATSMVNDFVFVSNKQVANEIYNQAQTKLKQDQEETNRKLADLDIQKKIYDDKLKDAADLIQRLELESKAKIDDIDNKLKDSNLSTQQIVNLELKKKEILDDIKLAKVRADADKSFKEYNDNQIQSTRDKIIIDSELNSLYTVFPEIKPTEDFQTIYNKIRNPQTRGSVSPEDLAKFYKIYDALDSFTKSSIPSTEIYRMKYGNGSAANNGGANGNNDGNNGGNHNMNEHYDPEVVSSLESLIKSGKLNMDLNTALETLKKNITPVTPGNSERGGQQATKTRDEKLKEAKF